MKKINFKIKKIIISNYADYVEGLSSNGGHYIDSTIYVREQKGLWRIEYASSGQNDFDFCPVCGYFCSHDHAWDLRSYERISTPDLIKLINELEGVTSWFYQDYHDRLKNDQLSLVININESSIEDEEY